MSNKVLRMADNLKYLNVMKKTSIFEIEHSLMHAVARMSE